MLARKASRVRPSRDGTISNWLKDVASAQGRVTRSTILDSIEKSSAFTQRSRFIPKPIPTMRTSDNALARMVHTERPRSQLGSSAPGSAGSSWHGLPSSTEGGQEVASRYGRQVMSEPVVVVAAVVVLDEQRRVLTVRKSGTKRFMLPGGKPEADEELRAAAIRELAEEVGLELADDDLLSWGTQVDVAANEPGTTVRAGVYAWTRRAAGTLLPAAEIAELRWLDVDRPTGELAPLLVTLLPRIIEFGKAS